MLILNIVSIIMSQNRSTQNQSKVLGEKDWYLRSSFLEIRYTVLPPNSIPKFPPRKTLLIFQRRLVHTIWAYSKITVELQEILYSKVKFFEDMYYQGRCKKLYFYTTLMSNEVLVCGIQFEIFSHRIDPVTKKVVPSPETNKPRIDLSRNELYDALEQYTISIKNSDIEDTTFTYPSINHKEPSLKFGNSKSCYYLLDNENNFHGVSKNLSGK